MTSISVIHDYIAGAIGGGAGMVVGHPFDTTKVQMQSQVANPYSGTWEAFKSINHEGWARGFFRGLSFPLVTYGAVNSICFGVYGNTLRAITSGYEKPSYLHACIAGCAGGAAQLVLACPADVVKVVLQSQIPRHTAGRHTLPQGRYFKGPMECVKHLYQERGLFRGVYKGFSVMGLRDLPATTSYFLIFEVTNDYMIMKRWTDPSGVFSNLMAGGLAGVLSWLLIVPIDVVKSQVQADYRGEKFTSAWHCAKLTYQRGGIPIFFTGALVTCMRAFPVNAVTFLFYKKILEFLDYSHHDPDRDTII